MSDRPGGLCRTRSYWIFPLRHLPIFYNSGTLNLVIAVLREVSHLKLCLIGRHAAYRTRSGFSINDWSHQPIPVIQIPGVIRPRPEKGFNLVWGR